MLFDDDNNDNDKNRNLTQPPAAVASIEAVVKWFPYWGTNPEAKEKPFHLVCSKRPVMVQAMSMRDIANNITLERLHEMACAQLKAEVVATWLCWRDPDSGLFQILLPTPKSLYECKRIPRQVHILHLLLKQDVKALQNDDDASSSPCINRHIVSVYLRGEVKRHYAVRLDAVSPGTLFEVILNSCLAEPEYTQHKRYYFGTVSERHLQFCNRIAGPNRVLITSWKEPIEAHPALMALAFKNHTQLPQCQSWSEYIQSLVTRPAPLSHVYLRLKHGNHQALNDRGCTLETYGITSDVALCYVVRNAVNKTSTATMMMQKDKQKI